MSQSTEKIVPLIGAIGDKEVAESFEFLKQAAGDKTLKIKDMVGPLANLARRAFDEFDTDRERSTTRRKGFGGSRTDGEISYSEFSRKIDEILDSPGEAIAMFKDDSLLGRLKRDNEIEKIANEVISITDGIKLPEETKAELKAELMGEYVNALDMVNALKPSFVPEFQGIPRAAIGIIEKEAKNLVAENFDSNGDKAISVDEFKQSYDAFIAKSEQEEKEFEARMEKIEEYREELRERTENLERLIQAHDEFMEKHPDAVLPPPPTEEELGLKEPAEEDKQDELKEGEKLSPKPASELPPPQKPVGEGFEIPYT